MALRINLYHEILRTRKQERYDPLKISIFGLILIAIGLVSWYFTALTAKGSAEDRKKARERENNELQPQKEKAEKEETEYQNRLALVEKLQKRMEDRFYWAPLLEELATATPPYVQISRVAGNLKDEKETRKGEITIDGVAAGTEARSAAQTFLNAIDERFKKRFRNPIVEFKTLDDGVDQVTLEGRQLKTATFSIIARFDFGTQATTPVPARKPRGAKSVAQQD